ncbi:MAG TPA: DUF4215 domain-containing protein [Kofleriaceae bacterium]|jgi:cysteine-rich repeat protein
MSWLRITTLLAALACALLALAGCATQPSSLTCSTGIVCPSPLKCAAVQAVCIENNCGDGTVDVGEACDDGNIIDGDGCSHDCKNEGCGNGTVDPGEDCDPPGPSTNGGTACSPTCKFEVCGNGVIDGDTHEQCDDGTANSDAACTTPAYANPPATCSNCTTSCTIRTVVGPFCGDHICEAADGEDITNCQEDCMGCGNGSIDPGEECDNGSGNTDTPCAAPAYDTATPNTPNTCSTCTTSCTISTVLGPYCGDGTCQGGDGETETNCPADCTGCGNGLLEGSEACDNGTENTDTPCTTPAYHNPPNTCSTCTTSCAIHTVEGPFCGNGTCDTGETKLSCPADCSGCGNGLLEGTEACDNGAANTDTKCATPAYANPPATCSTCNTSCQIVTVEGPFCGNGTCDATETKLNCPADCAGCGNGLIQGSEVCDDGAANTNTPCPTPAYNANPPNTCSYCTLSCALDVVVGPFCGDHACNNGETITSCPADCSGCGNGVINGTEACDNGAANTDTPCAAPAYASLPNPPNTCTTCTTSCAIDVVVGPYCGDGVCENTDEDESNCPSDCTGCGNSLIEGTEECDDGMANTDTPCTTPAYNSTAPNTCTTCTTMCKLDTVVGPFCGDNSCDATDGETKITCPHDCTGCGNGIKESGEECDNGAGNTNTKCTVSTYDNPPDTCSYCDTTCHLKTVVGSYCGDGVLDPGETCDGTAGVACPKPGDTGAFCGPMCMLDTVGCHS